MSGTFLKFTKVTKSYPVGERVVVALNSASFEIASGDTVALVGPSGSGKSTLLAIAAGLERPSSGEIALDNDLLNKLSEEELALLRRERIGFVFQSFQLLSSLTALENVMVPLELSRKSTVEKIAKNLLDRVGLSERCHHYPGQLSGGEQQRVALARAYSNSPKLLLADEPTGNLDESSATAVTEMLFSLNAELGTTLVIATHNPELAALAKRRLKLAHGECVDV